METKKDIRKRVLELRSAMSKDEWSEKSNRIQQTVIAHPFFLHANVIYCYIDYRNEAGTRSIIEKAWNLGKKVAVPKVESEEMNFYYISEFSDLQEGYRQILEPNTDNPANVEDALVIMPGVAFDKKRNRIGYGKGFYDKFLEQHPSYKTMALSFECQLVSEIQADAFDLKPDVLITEECIYDE